MRTATSALALLAVLGLALPAGAAATTDTWRYVAGGGTPDRGVTCTGGPGVAGVQAGGACDVPVRSADVSLSVVDDVQGHVDFLYMGFSAEGTGHGCGFYGYVTSPVVLTPPPGCVEIAVFPEAGSLVGTITASS